MERAARGGILAEFLRFDYYHSFEISIHYHSFVGNKCWARNCEWVEMRAKLKELNACEGGTTRRIGRRKAQIYLGVINVRL
jgi:hypothetical protein